ncbi:hypothetical protein GGI15_003476 [Coemansia interrupta]|uniref:Glutathione S-transferase n=1 Tax=Coemansia interrupta TaxID=1126814 RepID=A0A9W8HCD0_9FUNG|nr:hypothetical protein GGI15_003476 [Coemansia interrupta]
MPVESTSLEEYPYEENGHTLYSCATCPYAQRALRAFTIAGVPFRLVEIDLANKPSWYHLVNPLLQVPTLRTPSGDILTESLIIAEYVADQFPAANLLPAPALERAKLRLFLQLFSTHVITPYYRVIRATSDHMQAEKMGLLQGVQEVSRALEKHWGEDGGPFWAGGRFGFAEVATASFVHLFKVVDYYCDGGFEVPDTKEYAAFRRWARAIEADSAFTKVKPDDTKLIASYKRFRPE